MPYKNYEDYKAWLKRNPQKPRKTPRLEPSRDLSPAKITEYTYKGRVITLEKRRGRPLLRGSGVENRANVSIFPKEDYVKAATIFAATGSVKATSDICKVPEKIVREWLKGKAFKDLLEEVRNENDEKIDAKFTEIVEKALEGLQDRLEGGDHIYDTKRGEIVRKPIPAKELANIVSAQIEKRQLLRGKPTTRSEQVGEHKRLEQLAEQFIKMTQPKQTPVLEGEFVEIIEEDHKDAISNEPNERRDAPATQYANAPRDQPGDADSGESGFAAALSGKL